MRTLFTFFLLVLLSCSHVLKQKSPEEFFPVGQKVPLYNGKKLGYWKESDFIHQGEITALDSSIVIGEGGYLSGITWSGPLVRMNYEINLDARRIKGHDFFCGLTFPYGEKHCSFIVGGWGGLTTGLSNVDDEDASENETSDWMRFEQNRWYHIRVRVTSGKIQAWIDDRNMVDLDTKGRRIGIRSEVRDSIPLGIATYWTTAEIKNITLERLGR